MNAEDPAEIEDAQELLSSLCDAARAPPNSVLPTQKALLHARKSIHSSLPPAGLPLLKTIQHLKEDIAPALNASSRSANFYGFVTGGATPAAALADNFVTAFDQNVQVHLPNDSISTDVEDHALRLLCELLHLDVDEWRHRTFTTGATASNIIGLACGRDYVLMEALKRVESSENGLSTTSVADLGLAEAMQRAKLKRIQILTTMPHSSIAKAASVVGLGRSSVVSVGEANDPVRIDRELLESHLQAEGTASIVVISCGEVNTGRFATDSYDMASVRELCTKHGAWIHVDGAFGLLATLLSESSDKYEFTRLDRFRGSWKMEFADSIAGDAHKLLNVPYDCGFFFSQHLELGQEVLSNQGAAYLNSPSSDEAQVPSPLNVGLENSRRFRALPVYASLITYGRAGYLDMLERQVSLARKVANFILDHPFYRLLPKPNPSDTRDKVLRSIYIIVLFRCTDDELNASLVQRINASSKLYVSGTAWDGAPACRFAIANWQVNVERDFGIIEEVLSGVYQDHQSYPSKAAKRGRPPTRQSTRSKTRSKKSQNKR